MKNMPSKSSRGLFSTLPRELLIIIFDELVITRSGKQPVAYATSSVTTKTLHALTLVSRHTHAVASRYLYAYCLNLDTSASFNRFSRTFGIPLGPDQKVDHLECYRDEEFSAQMSKHISSLVISPRTESYKIQLSEIMNLFTTVGSTLKRLVLDFDHISPKMCECTFDGMPQLKELITRYHIGIFFPDLPPNIKRLAVSDTSSLFDHRSFSFSNPSLETMVMFRPRNLDDWFIERLNTFYEGQSLDVVLVDVNSNHGPPKGEWAWEDDDRVRIWEVDVPTSFYGDSSDFSLCQDFIWQHGIAGTLWDQDMRRMSSTSHEV